MLIPWNRVHHLLDDVHQSFFAPSRSSSRQTWRAFPHYPRWRVEGDVASLTLEVPGLNEDAIEVRVEADRLTIEGGAEPAVPEGYTLHRKERIAGNFSHQFTLERDWDSDAVSAHLQDGVLTVTIAKKAKASAKRIPLSIGPQEANDD